MSKWVLVPDGITEAVDAAKDFYELYKRTVVSGCTPMEQLRFVAALKFFESMLNAEPALVLQRRPLTEDETMHLMNETAGRQHWADEAHIQRFRKAVERAHGIWVGKI